MGRIRARARQAPEMAYKGPIAAHGAYWRRGGLARHPGILRAAGAPCVAQSGEPEDW